MGRKKLAKLCDAGEETFVLALLFRVNASKLFEQLERFEPNCRRFGARSLEPARTLPGPRDFNSSPAVIQRHQPQVNARFFKSLAAGVCSCVLVRFDEIVDLMSAPYRACIESKSRHAAA